ncbi:coenzyme Q-binding protein COQ10 homolog A, mitochondrial isoform X1 [Aethina tumida]|uniref:coenzyme Q-binding protein COQ10 homolog A, mitochondrial isoform X1 n=1 Tax=Aethina tumida TaxID=116153 RepID=UPI00096B1802|nr:coenzyme Q-binding protein COQ10 homolog A, mitochondrial isoform X1 [Aethina tumida]
MLLKCTYQLIPKRYISLRQGDRKKEYFVRKLIGYSSEEMYDVIADIKNYHKFVPFCTKSTILTEELDQLQANLEVGFPPIYENYTSLVTLKRPVLVQAICRDGRLFNYLETTWKLTRGLESNPKTCIIDFYINFEFKSLLHSKVAGIFFDHLCKQMESAFIKEAAKRYGIQSCPIYWLSGAKS